MFGGLLSFIPDGSTPVVKTTEGTSMVIKSKDVDLNKFTEENLIRMRQQFAGVCDDILARYLIARNDNFEQAAEQYGRALAWRAQSFPVLKASCLKEISSGKMYIRGVDKEGRPVLVYRTRLSFPKERDLEEAYRMIVWFAEHIFKRMPEDKSKYTMLIDRTDHTGDNTDMELMKHVSGKFQVSECVK